jgi:hypothetical protein
MLFKKLAISFPLWGEVWPLLRTLNERIKEWQYRHKYKPQRKKIMMYTKNGKKFNTETSVLLEGDCKDSNLYKSAKGQYWILTGFEPRIISEVEAYDFVINCAENGYDDAEECVENFESSLPGITKYFRNAEEV